MKSWLSIGTPTFVVNLSICAFLFAIAVSLLSQAAPAPVPPPPATQDADLRWQDPSSAPNALNPARPRRWIPTRRLSDFAQVISGGIWTGSLLESDRQSTQLFFSYTRIRYVQENLGADFGLEATNNVYLGWKAGYRWIFQIDSPAEFYARMGVGALYDPNESFGSFVNWKRYSGRIGFGSESFWGSDRRLHAELMGAYGGAGYSVQVSFGRSF